MRSPHRACAMTGAARVTYGARDPRGVREMLITISTPGAASAGDCEVAVEPWDGARPLAPDPERSGDDAPFVSGDPCVSVDAPGARLAVALPRPTDEDTLDDIRVTFSKTRRELRVSATLRTRGASIPSPPASSSHPRPAPRDDGDRLRHLAARLWLEAGGVACLSEDGTGGETPEATRWRAAFVDARASAAAAAAAAALDPTLAPDAVASPDRSPRRLFARKKDAPDPSDTAGVAALLRAQAAQRALATAARAPGRKRRRFPVQPAEPVSPGDAATILGARTGTEGAPDPRGMRRAAWNAPDAPPAAFAGVFSGVFADAATSSSGAAFGWDDARRSLADRRPRFARRPSRRVVLDGVASVEECRAACGAAVLAMEGARAPPTRDGETAFAVAGADDDDDENRFGAVRDAAGDDAAALVAGLCARARRAVALEFAEPRPLYLAGALLTRMRPREASASASPSERRSNGEETAPSDGYDARGTHVDAANIASYDYSAVLYLNAPGHSFEGGDFEFRDAEEDQAVAPKRGRLVAFASGFEHPHGVADVRRRRGGGGGDARFVLAVWFTLARERGVEVFEPEGSVPAVARAPAPARRAGPDASDLERILDKKVEAVKGKLGIDDAQLAELLAKLG